MKAYFQYLNIFWINIAIPTVLLSVQLRMYFKYIQTYTYISKINCSVMFTQQNNGDYKWKR